MPRPMLAITVLAVAGAVGAGSMTTAQLRAEQAVQRERAEADAQLGEAVDAWRRETTTAALLGRDAAASLRVLLAETIMGSETDGSEPADEGTLDGLDRRVGQLRDAAEQLRAAASDAPDRAPEGASATRAETLLARVATLADQARATADRLEAAAEDARRLGEAAFGLTTEARTYAAKAAEATERVAEEEGDPERLLAVWRDEADRLAPYRRAAETAAEHPVLYPLAHAHLELLDALEATASEAVDQLERDDLDAYNAAREQRLATTDTLARRLVTAIDRTLPPAVAVLEAGEDRALGLLTELEELRRAFPREQRTTAATSGH